MEKEKKVMKVKEPVKIRLKALRNGNYSIYLDTYVNGRRTYEFLKLYLIPEQSEADRLVNEETLQAANVLKAQRTIDLLMGRSGMRAFRNMLSEAVKDGAAAKNPVESLKKGEPIQCKLSSEAVRWLPERGQDDERVFRLPGKSSVSDLFRKTQKKRK